MLFLFILSGAIVSNFAEENVDNNYDDDDDDDISSPSHGADILKEVIHNYTIFHFVLMFWKHGCLL